MARLTFVHGDITQQQVDAIVNAANEALVGGGGVDGAIHRAGGPEIMAECERIRHDLGGCPTGSAVHTTAGRLPARAVIHTVGPVWRGGMSGEPQQLAACYRNALALAAERGYRTVAFPSISTGVYGYPIRQAAAVAVSTIQEELRTHPESFDEVRMVLFSECDLAVYETARAEGRRR
ncbi:MAG TPA: O-acetyl-ADP-ribose deacetylase [Candidatus Limnocylindrales bacterium]|nr:O-acetyl-ADP-ribose deacetylase [Candidatus Limnocylindrales bacterium]